MSKHGTPVPTNRREFFRHCAAIGGVTALAATVPGAVHPGTMDEVAPGGARKRAQGYRETPHVREYYAKARI
jgi:hypothetical protein